ncbi:MAG: PAS domain-containing sensor histidine kinase [Spongiibacteraceae bacterium]
MGRSMALPAVQEQILPEHIPAAAQLASAFEMFNELSAQLSDTYREMEQRVVQLDGELHRVAEQRLQELQEKERVASRLQSLLSLLPAGVIVLDQFGRIADCNPAAIDLLGSPPTGGSSLKDGSSLKGGSSLTGELWRDVIQRSFAPRGDDGHEISLRDGRRISIATRSLDGEPGQLLLLTDLTETRALQQRLSHHQRLSDMGKMVASLAHQIRTPLSTAMLYAGHLCEGRLSQAQSEKFAHKLLDRLQHLEQQVKDMLMFARSDVKLSDTITTTELFEAIAAAIEAPIAQANAELRITNTAESALLHCNKDSIVGALTNLVNNALQACGRDARIEIDCCARSIDSANWIAIAVTDNGPGFDQAIAERLNEPFFTTKSQGTGLGLAVVRAVAQAHQGSFVINAKSGCGARAELRLPQWQLHEHVAAHKQRELANP